MQEFGVKDFKRDRAARVKVLWEKIKADKKLEYMNAVMEGKVERRTKEERFANLKKWRARKGIVEPEGGYYEDCPHCHRKFRKALADKQRLNNREGGISCIPCIQGRPRKKNLIPP